MSVSQHLHPCKSSSMFKLFFFLIIIFLNIYTNIFLHCIFIFHHSPTVFPTCISQLLYQKMNQVEQTWIILYISYCLSKTSKTFPSKLVKWTIQLNWWSSDTRNIFVDNYGMCYLWSKETKYILSEAVCCLCNNFVSFINGPETLCVIDVIREL